MIKGGIFMKLTRKGVSAAILACVALTTFGGAHAAFDEHLDNYQLDPKVVKGDRTKDQFGNTVTEESYYRTGGDVKVITREEIEKRHYNDLSEAIKRIPGVAIQSPGYRGGEYGYNSHNNSLTINGDARVIVLVDGRRVDNMTSENIGSINENGSKSTGVNLDQVININAVDKIEVIKGPGASAYGSDATGGVINILTRKGVEKGQATLDISAGTWGHRKYDLTYLGSAGNDNSFHYFLGLNQISSGDTKFIDGYTGKELTLGGSEYKEKGASLRIDKDFDDVKRLSISYNHKQGKDGYPISTQDSTYWNENDWHTTIFSVAVGKLDDQGKLIVDPETGKAIRFRGADVVPGFRNIFTLDGGVFKSYNKFINNDIDVKYTFDRQGGMESFIRAYKQDHKYSGTMLGQWSSPDVDDIKELFHQDFPDGVTDKAKWHAWVKKYLAPFPGGSKEALDAWVEKAGGKAPAPNDYQDERKRGIQLQVARSIGKHDIIANISYDKDANYYIAKTKKGTKESFVKRNSLYGYVQDKIHVNDTMEITPALRFVRYSDSITRDAGEKHSESQGGLVHAITPSLNLQYRLDNTSTVYAGWSRVLRPLNGKDYAATYGTNNTPLEDEKGNIYTLGYQKEFNRKTILGVNYSLMDMSNSIAIIPIIEAENEEVAVNAKQKRQSFNVTLDHKFNKHWSIGLAYSHLIDKWEAKHGYTTKSGWKFDDPADINSGINNLRPANHYTLNINYDRDKLSSGLLINYYTGANPTFFTGNQFVVVDWNLNYDVTKDFTTYLAVTNLTNAGYETISDSYFGRGGASMPGRQMIVGAKYKF